MRSIAAGLGVEIEDLEEHHERVPAPERIDLGFGVVEAGTTAGLRFEVRGMVGGERGSCSSTSPDSTTHWPPTGRSRRRPPATGCIVEGNPNYTLDLQMMGDDGDHNTAGLAGTAGRIVNAIPAWSRPRPGLLSVHDLPLVAGRGLMRA